MTNLELENSAVRRSKFDIRIENPRCPFYGDLARADEAGQWARVVNLQMV